MEKRSLPQCEKCETTVYQLEAVSMNSVIYHKRCFRCAYCNGVCKVESCAMYKGTIYCKPHFMSLFRERGTYDFKDDSKHSEPKVKQAEKKELALGRQLPAPKTKVQARLKPLEKRPVEEEKPIEEDPRPALKKPDVTKRETKARSVEVSPGNSSPVPSTKCRTCSKTVYALEAVSMNSVLYHKRCFRCAYCNGVCKATSCAVYKGTVYCKPHFMMLFRGRGTYDFKVDEEVAKSALKATNTKSRPVGKAVPLVQDVVMSEVNRVDKSVNSQKDLESFGGKRVAVEASEAMESQSFQDKVMENYFCAEECKAISGDSSLSKRCSAKRGRPLSMDKASNRSSSSNLAIPDKRARDCHTDGIYSVFSTVFSWFGWSRIDPQDKTSDTNAMMIDQ